MLIFVLILDIYSVPLPYLFPIAFFVLLIFTFVPKALILITKNLHFFSFTLSTFIGASSNKIISGTMFL